MITTGLLAFASSFWFILLKAFQQLNVVHNNYLLVPVMSLLMALAEVFIIARVAEVGFGWIVLPIGLGSGIGGMAGMYLHGRMRKRAIQKQTGES
jgi:hypothetical protein